MSMSKASRHHHGNSPPPSGADSPGGATPNNAGSAAAGGKKRQTPVPNNTNSASHTPTVGVVNHPMGSTPRGFSGTTPRPNSRTQQTKGGNVGAPAAVPAACESPSGGPKLQGGLGSAQRSTELSGSVSGPGMSSLMSSGGGFSIAHQAAQASATPDTMMDEFDFMLTEENLQGGVIDGGMIQTGPVLTDFHGKMGYEKALVKPTAKPVAPVPVPATLTQPGVTRHGAVNPVGAETPNGQFTSQPNTPGQGPRPLSRAPAASVCNFCGSSVCAGVCAGARESSPLIVAALQPQRVGGPPTGASGSPAVFQQVGARLISPNHVGDGRGSAEDRVTPGRTKKGSYSNHVDPNAATASPSYAPHTTGKQQLLNAKYQQQTRNTKPVVFSDTMSNKSAAHSKLQRPLPSKMSDSSATASSINSCKTQPALALASDLAFNGSKLTAQAMKKSGRRVLRSHTGSAFSDTRSNMSVPSPTKVSTQHNLYHPSIEAAQANHHSKQAGKLH